MAREDSDAVTRVVSGASWAEFCDRLKAAGEVILDPRTPATVLDRAEGWRYLSRLTRIALEMMLEGADPDFPYFYQASHETAKIGADNPDNIYLNATVRADRDYVIRGTRGTVPYLTLGSKANRYAVDGTMATTGELDLSNIELAVDGSFEVIASRTPKPGNWLPMADDTSMLIVRQTFLDRANEVPAQMTIARLDGPSVPEPLSAERLDRGLASAAAFVNGTARTFVEWTELFRQRPNEMPALDQAMFQRAGGDPKIFYYHGYWSLGPDEALVIDTEIPECELWNIQLDNYWMESLDYRYHQICINKHSVRTNADGTATFVVAARDPGIGNWLDTAGHETGTLLLRWTGAKTHPTPRCRVVKLAEVEASAA